ncbi:MAG: acetate--CoA ligase family protein [Halanaeroarchaeum sp.]
MGHLPLDPLLAPSHVVVVGDADAAPDADAETTVLDPDVDPATLPDADLALVTSRSEIVAVVEALIDADVPAIVVTDDVPDRAWFDLVETATAADVALLGPEASFARPVEDIGAGLDESPDAGSVALVTEDQATLAGLTAEGVRRSLGFSLLLATGRHPTARAADAIETLEGDPATDVALVRPARIDRDFFETARDCSPALSLAVHAPNWSIADAPVPLGEDLLVRPAALRDATLAQAGVLTVDSVDRLLDLAPALAEQPLPDGDRVVIVSNAGGPGVMATDAVGTSRLSMADLADETVDALEEVIPDRAFAQNPLDLLADSDIEVFRGVLDAVLADPGVDAAVVISAPNPLFTFEELAEIVADARSRHESPVVTALMGGESTAAAAEHLRRVGIPNYFDPFQAVQVIAALADQRDAAARRRGERERAVAVSDLAVGRSASDLLTAAGLPDDDVADGVSVSVAGSTIDTMGPIVAVGLTDHAAVLDDVAVRVAPIGTREAVAMLDDLRGARLLKGARGTAAVDVDALAEAIARIGAIVDGLEGVREVSATLRAGEDGIAIDEASVDRHQ